VRRVARSNDIGTVRSISCGWIRVMILAISTTEAPTFESSLLSRSTFSMRRKKFRDTRLTRKVNASSFRIDLWMVFMTTKYRIVCSPESIIGGLLKRRRKSFLYDHDARNPQMLKKRHKRTSVMKIFTYV